MIREGTPFSVTLEERDAPKHSVTALLGDKPPIPKEGGGGYEVVQLPKRAAVTVWKGRGLMVMQLPIMFPMTVDEKPVLTPEVETLIHMWRPLGSPPPEPPVLEISSPGDVVPFADLEWVIEDLEWGDAVADARGNRTQQQFVVVLREYRADERLQTADQAKRKAAKARYYRVKRADMAHGLVGIAHKLHVKGGARVLGLAQHPPIHDPRHIHPNQLLAIPVTTTVRGHGSITAGAQWGQSASGSE